MVFKKTAGWLTWLNQRVNEIIGNVLVFFLGNKVASAAETRQIEVGAAADGKKHNQIKTSRYTLLTFIPQNLAEQFRRVVNFYFLIVTVIAVVIDSPVSPLTSIAPLSFMVMVTAVKNGYEDWLRHKADDHVNNRIGEGSQNGAIVKLTNETPNKCKKCQLFRGHLSKYKRLSLPDNVLPESAEIVQRGVIKEVRNSTIAPGTLVRVKRGKEVPADLVLLCSEGERGKCFVTTANLDGETNLKTLRVPPPLIGYTPDVLPQGMKIEVPNPIADLYTFYGRLEIPHMESLPLTTDNLMLRGSRVKNTEWAIGCAVYTGEETKLALNSKYAGNKFSSCELAVNGFLVVFIVILFLEIVISYIIKRYVDSRHQTRDLYLGPGTAVPQSLSSVLQDMFSFLLLYYYIIPMSLYVTIELYKFIGALFIGWDEELRCEDTGKPAIANTSDLNEELGQVEVLFSDKTGTLTKNVMAFKACSIKGNIYEERDRMLFDVQRFEEPVDTRQADIRFFFKVLALCHSVQISNEDMKRLSARLSMTGDLRLINMFKRKKAKKPVANGNAENGVVDNSTWNTMMSVNNVSGIDYQASSPDEKALVEAADRLGVTFLGEEGNNLIVKVGDETEMYERLQMIEFTSERKRMSVVVRDKDGKILLFCKGAESAVFPLCRNTAMIDKTNVDINTFATKGLRTLAIAYREIPEEEYERVCESIKKQDVKNAEALQQVTHQYRLLERDLTLVGATAVEDCLQDDVADTLASLRRAGVRIWVLTGDKVETAINVAQSCAHITENGRQMFLIGVDNDEAVKSHLEECKRILAEPSYKDLALIVDGTSMSWILDKPAAPEFAEISLKCNAVLCCRLSPIQKAKIVKLIKLSPGRPITAAIGDGANDISMIHEAHVGFGIFGKEGYQAARSADFAFTKFSMVKKFLLVMGHWYYQRLATLIHYFFYKNLVLGNLMLFFQINSAFSTQSIFDSMYLTFFNLFFTAVPCLVLSVTEQRWPQELLLRDPTLYRDISRNKLMSWSRFSVWLLVALYHSIIIYTFGALAVRHSVINADMKAMDIWIFGAVLFHLLVLITNLKLWLQARYNTMYFVLTIVGSVLFYMLFNLVYSLINLHIDGAILGTYTRLCSSLSFWLLNVLVVVATLAPDYCYRYLSDKQGTRLVDSGTTVFTTRL